MAGWHRSIPPVGISRSGSGRVWLGAGGKRVAPLQTLEEIQV